MSSQIDNVDEMLEVAKQYEAKGTVGSYQEALKWFGEAAQNGSKYACLKAAAICIALAKTYEDNDLDDVALATWEKGAYYASLGIPGADEDMRNFDIALKEAEECLYGAATWYYILGNLETAMETLDRIGIQSGNARADLLYAVCLGNSIKKNFTEEDRNKMRALIGPVFAGDSTYVSLSVVGAARHMEQLIFARAAVWFSWMITEEERQDVLTRAYQALSDESATREISNELNQ